MHYYFFYEYVEHWNSVGITTIFTSGNNGQGCTTIGYPGAYQNVIDVGAVDGNVTLAYFSSVGPAMTTKPLRKDDTAVAICSLTSCGFNNKTCLLIKPTVVTPGMDIQSAWNTSDTAFILKSGTSIAAPHVAGVVALMLCAKNKRVEWNHRKSYDILTTTTDTSRIDLMGDRQNKNDAVHKNANLMCNVMLSNICNSYPNNMYGFGLVNACRAVRAVKNLQP